MLSHDIKKYPFLMLLVVARVVAKIGLMSVRGKRLKLWQA